MTVSSENSKDGPYNCNGSQVTFPFTFKVFSKNDLMVVLTNIASDVETDLTVDADFSVSLNANQNTSPGGTITTVSTYTAAEKITIVRDMETTQQVSVTNFRPDVTERVYDKLTMLIQQVKEGLSRAVKVKVSSSGASPDDLIASIEASVNQSETFALEAAASSGEAETAATNAQNSADDAQASAVAAANSAATVDVTSGALQHQSKTAFNTVGTAPNFAVTSFPLYGAYTANERMRVVFNDSVSSGAVTLDRDGLGAQNLKQYANNGFKTNALITAGHPYDIEYDGVDFVILNPVTPILASPLELVGGRIKFPATQVPSTDANTLDDYEEGTWTASLVSSTQPIDTYSATYIKIGRLVSIRFSTTLPTQTDADQVLISGVPFVPGSSSEAACSILSSEATALRASLLVNNIFIQTSAGAAVSYTTMSGDYLTICCTYLTAN